MFAVHISPKFDAWLPDWVITLPAGRSSILFAVLAGVSISLIAGEYAPARREDRQKAMRAIAIRAGCVFMIGIALVLLRTPIAVILTYYAALFLIALPLLQFTTRSLIIAAAVLAIAGPVLQIALWRLLLPTGVLEMIDRADPFGLSPSTSVLNLILFGAYPAVTWLPFVIVGIAVGRANLRSLRFGVLAIIGLGLSVAGYGLSVAVLAMLQLPAHPTSSDLVSGTSVPSWSSLLYAYPHSGMPFEIVGGVGSSLVVIDLCLMLARRLPALCWPVTAVGAMPLTIYVLQALALELPGLRFDRTDSIWVLIAFVFGATTVAMAWLARYRRGPLEGVLHAASTPGPEKGSGSDSGATSRAGAT